MKKRAKRFEKAKEMYERTTNRSLLFLILALLAWDGITAELNGKGRGEKKLWMDIETEYGKILPVNSRQLHGLSSEML